MTDPTHHREFPLDLFHGLLVGDHAEGQDRDGSESRRAILRNLEVVRSHLDEAIGSCAELEARGDLVEIDDRWRFTPHRLTEVDSLRRLMAHLDRVEARLLTTYFPREGRGPAAPLREIDRALVDRAAALARRFEDPASRHDIQADLEAGFGDLERLVDAHDRAFSDDAPRTASPARAEPGEGHDAARIDLDEYRDVLDRVDRHVLDAAGDAPLQGFWRGVNQRYREEIDRRLRPAGGARPAPRA